MSKILDYLSVSLVQSNIIWEKVEDNLRKLSKMINKIEEQSDLIILPEMFTSGFTMRGKEKVANYAEQTLEWMQKNANKKKAHILGSIIIKEKNNFFNRLYVISPNGQYQYYDKRHLFRMGQEHLHFEHGNKVLIFEIGKWKIRPLICYDLRFPVWSRNRNNYDLLIYIANWPQDRHNVWDTLLRARALENMSYVVGVNIVGTYQANLNYSGGTIALDARGKTIYACKKNEEDLSTVKLSFRKLQNFRNKFPVHKDADPFEILT